MPNKKYLLKLIQWHLREHHNIRIQDVYKLLYQGVFGAEHLINDVTRAKNFLIEEWSRLPADKLKVLIEPVSPDGRLVRANLRRCKAEGLDVQNVWRAFYDSVGQVKAEKIDFEKSWQQFVEFCESGDLPFDPMESRQFGKETKAANWPAKHHSPEYRESNYPAYRVVLKVEFNRFCLP
jgi:hypothetical protein